MMSALPPEMSALTPKRTFGALIGMSAKGPIADIRHPMINSWARIKHRLRKLKTGHRAAKII